MAKRHISIQSLFFDNHLALGVWLEGVEQQPANGGGVLEKLGQLLAADNGWDNGL